MVMINNIFCNVLSNLQSKLTLFFISVYIVLSISLCLQFLTSHFNICIKHLFYHNHINNVANWYFQDGMHQSRDILSRQFFMLGRIFLFFPYSMLFFLFAYRSGLSQIYMVKTCRRSSSIVLLQTVSPCLYINENHIEYFLCGSNHGLYSKFFLI